MRLNINKNDLPTIISSLEYLINRIDQDAPNTPEVSIGNLRKILSKFNRQFSRRKSIRHRLKVIEHFNGYSVQDTKTGLEHSMGDGVDTLSTPSGKTMHPGSEYFRKTWENILNASLSESLEAYFPGQE